MGTTHHHDQGNEGEGNKTADRNYREATREFVESERGKREIEKAGHASPEQEKELRRAEEEAKRHAHEHDPEEVIDTTRPASKDTGKGAAHPKDDAGRFRSR
jgi:hypothetical protein